MAGPSVRTVDWYIDRAMIRSGAASERKLSARIGLAHNSVTNYRTRRAWPSDHAMVRIAELAGIDPDIALMDLNAWRAKDEAVSSRYTRLAKMLEKVGAAIAITGLGLAALLATPTGTHAEQNDVVSGQYTLWKMACGGSCAPWSVRSAPTQFRRRSLWLICDPAWPYSKSSFLQEFSRQFEFPCQRQEKLTVKAYWK